MNGSFQDNYSDDLLPEPEQPENLERSQNEEEIRESQEFPTGQEIPSPVDEPQQDADLEQAFTGIQDPGIGAAPLERLEEEIPPVFDLYMARETEQILPQEEKRTDESTVRDISAEIPVAENKSGTNGQADALEQAFSSAAQYRENPNPFTPDRSRVWDNLQEQIQPLDSQESFSVEVTPDQDHDNLDKANDELERAFSQDVGDAGREMSSDSLLITDAEGEKETLRPVSHQGYIVIHENIGLVSLKGGISLEDAEKFYEEYARIKHPEEDNSSFSQTEAEEVQSGEEESIQPEEDRTAERVDGGPVSRKIDELDANDRELPPDEQHPENGIYIGTTVTEKTIGTATDETSGLEHQTITHSAELSGNPAVSSDTDLWTGLVRDSVEEYPEKGFEEPVYDKDVPEEIHSVVETLLDEIPPSHLAGICNCQVHQKDDQEAISVEFRRHDGGGLELIIIIPPGTDPKVAREYICTGIATNVERLLSDHQLPGSSDWLETYHRISPTEDLSYEANHGTEPSFIQFYVTHRNNPAALDAEFPSGEAGQFFRDLDTATITR